jgi:hypothetical protein
MGLISPQVESAVLRRLKLLKCLQDVKLRPEEAQALMQRVETNTCSAADRDLLAQVIRATTQVSAQLLDPSPQPEPRVSERPSPQRKAKRKRQLAQASRRRHRG